MAHRKIGSCLIRLGAVYRRLELKTSQQLCYKDENRRESKFKDFFGTDTVYRSFSGYLRERTNVLWSFGSCKHLPKIFLIWLPTDSFSEKNFFSLVKLRFFPGFIERRRSLKPFTP